MKKTTRLAHFPAILSILLPCCVCAADSHQQMLETLGVRGGLVVQLGCGDGDATAALCTGKSFLVQALDEDPTNVEQARVRLRNLGLYGRVSVNTFDGRHLPYVDNLVNAVLASDLGRVPMDEVMRVLAPRGVAIIAGRPTVKPWPEEIDEWPQFLHGADNNALADDQRVGPPRHMQWLAGPMWTRHHHADKGTDPTIRAVVSAQGRLYYMADETKSSIRDVPASWYLVARDAFSGVLLWKKAMQVDGAERRLEKVWRTLIADGPHVYVPLGPDRPLSALDGASGQWIRDFEDTGSLQEVIKDQGILLTVNVEYGLQAFQADTGRRLWQWTPEEDDPIVPLTLAASEGHTYVKTDKGVHCLDTQTGEVLWYVPLAGPEKDIRLRYPRERLIVVDGVVLCTHGGKDPKDLDRDTYEFLGSHPRVRDYGGKLSALSTVDGKRLWQTDYLPGLESMPGEIYIAEGQVWLGPDFAQPRNLQTGETNMDRPVLDRLWTDGHHYRCYPGKATCNYIVTAKRGIELIDLNGESHSRNNWVRATCRVGVTPCNGLLYAPPHSCGCYMEAKLFGFWALAAGRQAESRKVEGQQVEGQQVEGQQVEGRKSESLRVEELKSERVGELKTGEGLRLVRGAAFGAIGEVGNADVEAKSCWPMYRSDVGRSGGTGTRLPSDLDVLWDVQIGGRLTQPVCADGRLVVAEIDAHTVHCLDTTNGDVQWSHTTGGRVDSPPTLYRGMVLFGSRDGWVYCVRAADGVLVWRRLAAPREVNAVAYEQLESLWPVHGSVLIHNDIAYVSAGRSSYLDGGIVLYGLQPETGSIRCTTRLASEHAGIIDPPQPDERSAMDARISQNSTDYKTFLAADRSDAFSMRGALPDIMTADGESIYMRHMRFGAGLKQQETKLPHLFSTSSLLDGSEHHRSYWVLGTGDFSRTPVAYPWIVTKSLKVPYGLMLTYDAKTVWCVQRSAVKGRSQAYALVAAQRPELSDPESLYPDFARRAGQRKATDPLWTAGIPIRPRAMLRAGGTLVIGGQPLSSPSGEADAESDNDQTGHLLLASHSGGQTLGAVHLPSPPVWDGMAAADGKLYVATTRGNLVCLE